MVVNLKHLPIGIPPRLPAGGSQSNIRRYCRFVRTTARPIGVCDAFVRLRQGCPAVPAVLAGDTFGGIHSQTVSDRETRVVSSMDRE